jgi:hypothetical protein
MRQNGYVSNLQINSGRLTNFAAKLLMLVGLLMVLVLATANSANAQTTSESNATSQSSQELRDTLQRSLDKVLAQSGLIFGLEKANEDAATIIRRQEAEKAQLEEVIGYKDRTIAAKDEALKSERAANAALHTRALLADRRIEQLEDKLRSANKRNKLWFIVGAVGGAIGTGLITR